MSDPRLEKWARVLVDYATAVKPGDKVALRGTPAAAPLLLTLYRQVLERGAYPHLLVSLPGAAEIFYRVAEDHQLTFVSPIDRLVVETFDVLISVLSETNTRSLSTVDPARQAKASAARRDLTRTYMERAARGELRWVLTLYPTEAYAQEAEMSLQEFEDFVYEAGWLNDEDPVARWQEQAAFQARLVEWLKGRRRVYIRGPNADLVLGIEGRTFISADGRHNFPDGEIFTGPEETVTEGWVRFTYPALYGGREVDGVELVFEGGRVVKATAKKNEAFLHRMLETDEGARRLGELGIGTNFAIRRFTRNILFDEKLGGTFHLALGAAYPETGGTNQSAIHWDLICDLKEGEIVVDGEVLYRDGKFMIG
ncbi:aminopeptidase [Thermoflexus hugenholtzii]|uniref:Leucyl aminopeptidase (Aminopeptidase T) n=1 Tax=Thermoflexus hugenholtzii JAD2 TaxID=877466 RepID=A0A212QRT4_9CHLR|nr:aminopeptidase [Thermoflexus hugenholtzii]SNB62292.1 Leucyl aminopeptidase (aminopeptidase T) [Thermoflexus hugenholtzii JAD2]